MPLSRTRIEQVESKILVVNREYWLTEVAQRLTPLFKGFQLRKYRVTCGWPCKHALGRKMRRVGECHFPSVVPDADGYHDLFISPLLDDPLEVAGTLAHEICHVVAGHKAGHSRGFVKIARHIGLTKNKPTSAMPGEKLNEKISVILDKLGPYPHTAIKPILVEKEKKKSSVKLECECGCVISMSTKWIEEVGLPTCACGKPFVSEEEEDQ